MEKVQKKQDNKDIYIYGELTNWDFLPEAKMRYNAKDEKYYSLIICSFGVYFRKLVNENFSLFF